MKKVLLSLVVLVAVSTASFAQLSGGIRAGVNLSDNSGDDVEVDMKAGFQLGLYLVGNLSDKIALQPELVYSSLGSKDDDDSYKFNYISIPVLVRYNINDMINIHVGPQFGILASAKYGDEDIKDGLKGLDTGLALGVGLDFAAFNAGLRYYAGLSNISDADGGDLKNNAIQIVVGYRLFGGE
jgi:hypothetical protein